jgi:hypothetical protein
MPQVKSRGSPRECIDERRKEGEKNQREMTDIKRRISQVRNC